MRFLNALTTKTVALLFLSLVAVPAQIQAQRITLWEHEKDLDQKILDEIIKKFEAKHKKIKVKRSHYKTEDLRTQFQTAALGGGGADIVLAPNDFGGPFSIMRIIQPVNAFAKLDRFNEQTVAAVTDANDITWGFPVSNGNHLLLLLNKALVHKVPETMTELIESAKKVGRPKDSLFGFAYNLNEPFWFVTFLAGYGERPLVNRKPRLNTAGMVNALNFVHSLKFVEKVTPGDCDYSCADTLFVDGKAAMIINGDWSVARYKKALDKNLIIAPLPKIKAGDNYMAPMVSGKYIFFNRRLSGAKMKAARKFAEYLVSTEIQTYWLQRSQRLPALKSMMNSKVVTDDEITMRTLEAMQHGQPMPMDVEMRAIWDAMRPELQKVMAGRLEPKTAAANMQKNAETKIKEMREE